jgi:hypothetical protein
MLMMKNVKKFYESLMIEHKMLGGSSFVYLFSSPTSMVKKMKPVFKKTD